MSVISLQTTKIKELWYLLWNVASFIIENLGLSHYSPHEIIAPHYGMLWYVEGGGGGMEATGYQTTNLGGGGHKWKYPRSSRSYRGL